MANHLIEIENAESDLLACAAFIAEGIGSADGHAASVSDAALRYAARGEVDLAASLADTIQDPHTRDVVLTEIAVRCVDLDDDEYALQLAGAMEDYGFQQQALHNIAARQASHGRLEEAVATAETMDDSLVTFGEIAARFHDAGDTARADEILEQIDLPSVRVQVLNAFAAAQIKRGESPVEILNQSLAETKDLEVAEERVQIFLEIAARFHDAGECEKAQTILERAAQLAERLEGRFRDSAFTQIALQYARIGDFAAAENSLDPIEDMQQTAQVYTGIALEYADADDLENAAANLEEAYAVLKSQPDRAIRDSKSRFQLFATIAIQLAQIGKSERGLEIALENPVEASRNTALTNIAAICAAQNNETLAHQAANSIEDFASRIFAYLAMSDAEKQNGSDEKSLQILNEAHSLSEEVEQMSVRSQALNEIAVRFAETEDAEKASAVLHESLKTAQTILDQSHQSNALVNLAETYEKLNLELTEQERGTLHLIVRKRLAAV